MTHGSAEIHLKKFQNDLHKGSSFDRTVMGFQVRQPSMTIQSQRVSHMKVDILTSFIEKGNVRQVYNASFHLGQESNAEGLTIKLTFNQCQYTRTAHAVLCRALRS